MTLIIPHYEIAIKVYGMFKDGYFGNTFGLKPIKRSFLHVT